jgi:protein-S-isoprenylcysteine O-methyltransferase Ste14
VLCLAGPGPPPAFCPGYANVSPDLLAWNIHTALCIILILVAGRVRLLAYKQLGLDFTFTVHKPKKLITTGLYRYVQHPSYAGLITLMIANRVLFERLDGVAACWLPTWIVNLRWIWMMAMILKTLGWALMRIRDEEEMMKETFGKEWDDYHAKTKRLIPGLF